MTDSPRVDTACSTSFGRGIDSDFEIVFRTPVAPGCTVISARRTSPHAIQPFVVFLTVSTSRYPSNARDFSDADEAARYHAHLVRTFSHVD